jgi:hypothetical protein
MIRRRESQFRIVDTKVAAFEIEQAARPPEIVQQMTINVQQIGIIANSSDDVLVPDFGQQRKAGLFQWLSLLLLLWPATLAAGRRFCTACYSGLSLSASKHSKLPLD